jgi:hypothetical protein
MRQFMSQTNAHLDFSEKAKRINTIAPFAYENPIYEPSTHPSVTEQEEPMNTTQNQTTVSPSPTLWQKYC